MDKLFLGNSIELIKSFSDESVHAIISDIPYGIGYDDWMYCTITQIQRMVALPPHN